MYQKTAASNASTNLRNTDQTRNMTTGNLMKKFYSNKKMITLKIMSQSLVIKTLWYEATNDMTKTCQTSIKNLYLQFS